MTICHVHNMDVVSDLLVICEDVKLADETELLN